MRSIAKLMKDWQFTGPNGVTTAVELPHTWNAKDGQDGGNDYWRGCCTYCTRFAAPVYDPAQQQVWLQFEGVNASAAVLLNGQQLCTHDGGYSTFRAEVTELLQAENQLTVRVDNSVNDRVYPQKADFTFYGGIYRDVSLLVVNIISPLRPPEQQASRSAQYELKVIRRIVQKYKGTLTLEEQGEFFAEKIIFPLQK